MLNYILLILYQSVFARMSGGGIWTRRPPNFSEAMFAIPFSLAWFDHDILWCIIAFLWAYGWFQTGHAVAFHMGAGENYAAEGRKALLSYVVDPICLWTKRPLGGKFYCWLFMGLKGFLVHAPLCLMALPAAVLWPLAYYIGNIIVPRFRKDVDGEMVAEFLSGAFSGIMIATALLI